MSAPGCTALVETAAKAPLHEGKASTPLPDRHVGHKSFRVRSVALRRPRGRAFRKWRGLRRGAPYPVSLHTLRGVEPRYHPGGADPRRVRETSEPRPRAPACDRRIPVDMERG